MLAEEAVFRDKRPLTPFLPTYLRIWTHGTRDSVLCSCSWNGSCSLAGVGPAAAEPLGVDTVAAPPATPTQAQPQRSRGSMRRSSFSSGGSTDESMKTLETAVKSHPELPPAEVIMVQWFSQTNQPAASRLYLEKAVLTHPEDPEAYVILGEFALQDRRVTEAGLVFDKATELLKTFNKSRSERRIWSPAQ